MNQVGTNEARMSGDLDSVPHLVHYLVSCLSLPTHLQPSNKYKWGVAHDHDHQRLLAKRREGEGTRTGLVAGAEIGSKPVTGVEVRNVTKKTKSTQSIVTNEDYLTRMTFQEEEGKIC